MDHIERKPRKPHPTEKANIVSALTFFYSLKLFKKGWKRDLEEENLYEVLSRNKSKQLGDKLETEWEKQGEKKSVLRLLAACYAKEYLLLGLSQLIVGGATILVQPRALGKLISYFNPGQTELTKSDAYFYACTLLGFQLFECVYSHNYQFALTGLGIRIRTAFCSFIYRKALKLSPSRLSDISIGKIVTLITKDVQAFESFVHFANDLWIGIVKTIIVSYIIYRKIGIAAFAGVGFFIVILPLQMYLGAWTTKLRLKVCKKTDERLQTTQETLSAIRIIKMYTWEKFFQNKVVSTRLKEIKSMQMIFYLTFIVLQIGSLNGKIAFYLLIMTYKWLGNLVTAEVVYFLDSCFQILTHTMSVHFPIAISISAQLIAAINRIGNVLKALEIQESLDNQIAITPKITLRDVSVTFKETEILHSINLTLETGVTLITGPVGSGKSFLLKTILKNYEATSGKVVTQGRVSYASQEPWLFPSSIKQNILFGEKYDEQRYQEVLKICALLYDFELLSAGDSTIVEDRGINLSKGQQARINLARAVYKESDIYLLDDCLSALDAQVSDYIFQECIQKFLKNRLVVFVAHNVKYVKEVDEVVIMYNGTVKSSAKSIEIAEDAILDEVLESVKKNVGNVEDQEVDEESKLIIETTKERKVYQETKKIGDVDYAVYNKYMRAGGGVFALMSLLSVYVIAQFVQSYAEVLVSKWVNLEQEIANFSLYNDTNTTELYPAVEKMETRDYTLKMYTAMIILTAVFNLTRCFILFAMARSVSLKLHRQMIGHIINAKMYFFDTNFIGNILNRFSKDLTIIDEQLAFIFHHFFRALLLVIGIMIVIATVNTVFLIPTCFFFLVLTAMRKFYLPTARSLKRMDASTRSPVIGHLNASLEGLTTIRAFQAEEILKDEFDRHQDLYTSASYLFQNVMRAFAFFLDIFCTLFTASIVGRFVIFDNKTSAGNVGLAISQALRMTGTLQWGIRQWAEIENAMTSVERALEYTEVKQENKHGQELEKWPSKGEVKYQNVHLSYNNSDEYVLKDINFVVHSKEKIGIVGRTGAGKSSIIATLFRLYEVEGRITVDDVDIKLLSLDFFRKHISIIPQDPVLFTGTIRDNIDPEGTYTDDEIWRAVETANLKKLVPSLDFEITENGSNFSIGQRQLICLARAVIRNNKIIVLDEATANMDPETDALIHETIHANFESCTVFIIAHKLNSILKCDKVIVMDKGEIVEYDEPFNLLHNRDGPFYKMVKNSGLLPLAIS